MSSQNPNSSPGMSPGTRTLFRVIVAVIACLALLFPLVGGVSGFVNRVATKESTEELELPAEMENLEVAGRNGKTIISTTPAHTGTVRLEYKGTTRAIPKLALDTDGTTTTVGFTGADRNVFMEHQELTLRVEIPESQAADLGLVSTTSFGHSEITGAYRSVDASTQTGFVEADVEADVLSLTASTGAVEARGTARTATFESSVGAIDVREFSASEKIDVKTTTGAVNMALGTATLPTEGIAIEATTGAVDLRVPRIEDVEDTEAIGYLVNARTNSGASDITIDEVTPNTEEPHIPISVNSSEAAVAIGYV